MEAMCYVANDDLVGAAPTGEAPTTYESSANLLPNKPPLILEVRLYILYVGYRYRYPGSSYMSINLWQK